MSNYNIERFYSRHESHYGRALTEIKQGRKLSCWMWYIFPQLKILGKSSKAIAFGLENAEEAAEFYNDAYLGKNLAEISEALLQCECSDPYLVMGMPDDKKLQSSMTLFYLVTGNEIFKKVLDKFFDGEYDVKTVDFLSK